jgi:hypothetical protein
MVTPKMLRSDAALLDKSDDHSLARNAREAADQIERMETGLKRFTDTAVWSTAFGGSGFEWRGSGNPRDIAEAALFSVSAPDGEVPK